MVETIKSLKKQVNMIIYWKLYCNNTGQEEDMMIIVVINEEFVPSDEKETTVLKEGDVVEFLYFMGGGC